MSLWEIPQLLSYYIILYLIYIRQFFRACDEVCLFFGFLVLVVWVGFGRGKGRGVDLDLDIGCEFEEVGGYRDLDVGLDIGWV